MCKTRSPGPLCFKMEATWCRPRSIAAPSRNCTLHPVFSKTATADSNQSGCLCTLPLDLAAQRADRQKSVTTGGLSTKTSAILMLPLWQSLPARNRRTWKKSITWPLASCCKPYAAVRKISFPCKIPSRRSSSLVTLSFSASCVDRVCR